MSEDIEKCPKCGAAAVSQVDALSAWMCGSQSLCYKFHQTPACRIRELEQQLAAKSEGQRLLLEDYQNTLAELPLPKGRTLARTARETIQDLMQRNEAVCKELVAARERYEKLADETRALYAAIEKAGCGYHHQYKPVEMIELILPTASPNRAEPKK